MNDLVMLFDEATTMLPAHNYNGETFVIHKGFKIIKYRDGIIDILNTRSSDLYKELSYLQLETLMDNGFLIGCAMLQHKRLLTLLVETSPIDETRDEILQRIKVLENYLNK